VVCFVAGVVSAFFLFLYRRYPMPVGWDTARYLDQANLATVKGVSGVAHVVLPRPSTVLASRVGFPVTVLTLSHLFHTSLFTMAATVPIAAIAATAVAAGAFVSSTLRRGPWELAVVAAVVGLSASLIRLIAGTYTDNLLAASLFVTMLTPLVFVAREGRGFVGAILLLTVGGLVHPAFFAVMIATLAVVAAAYAPSSWRAWRSGRTSFWSTPATRVGTVVGGAGGLTAIGIFGVLGVVPDTPALARTQFVRNLRQDLPLYRLPLTVPAAAIGAGALVLEERRARPGEGPATSPAAAGDGDLPRTTDQGRPDRFTVRFVMVVLGAWILVAGAGIAAFYAGRDLPAHRFLAFLLPVPILIGLAVLAAGRWVLHRTGGGGTRGSRALAGRIVAVGVVAAALVAVGVLGYQELYGTLRHRGIEWLEIDKIHDAVAAGGYLDAERIPYDRPVVFVITDVGPQPQLFVPEEAHMIRAALPARRIQQSYFYVGTAANFLAGRPTLIPGDRRGYNTVSQRFWRGLQAARTRDPVAVVLKAFNPDYLPVAAEHPDWVVASDVLSLTGPRPPTPVPTPPVPTAPQGLSRAGPFGIGTLVALVVFGMGWAIALLPAGLRPFEVLALSAGFGVAFLILGGTLADVAGVRLAGPGGALTGPVVGAMGWILAAVRLRRRGWALVFP
jgi:hypothetical protein